MKTRFHRILLIDDDADERALTDHALKLALPTGSTVHLAVSGDQAIRYMIGEGEYADRRQFPFPTLVITDLNMPDGDGFDVLEFLKANPQWSVVPRILFSSSSDDDDVRTAFALGASAVHVKPISSSQLAECMRAILEYWARCEIPPIDESGKLALTTAGRRGFRYPQPGGSSVMERPHTPAHNEAARVVRLL